MSRRAGKMIKIKLLPLLESQLSDDMYFLPDFSLYVFRNLVTKISQLGSFMSVLRVRIFGYFRAALY